MNEIEDALEEYFPKGDKSRGKVLVLFALFQNELNKSREVINNLIEEKLQLQKDNNKLIQMLKKK